MRKLNPDKLSVKQNMIIHAMQKGWELITANTTTTIWCVHGKAQFEFSSTIFWNLVEKELIRQQSHPPFEYVLTEKGKYIVTKKVDLSIVD